MVKGYGKTKQKSFGIELKTLNTYLTSIGPWLYSSAPQWRHTCNTQALKISRQCGLGSFSWWKDHLVAPGLSQDSKWRAAKRHRCFQSKKLGEHISLQDTHIHPCSLIFFRILYLSLWPYWLNAWHVNPLKYN